MASPHDRTSSRQAELYARAGKLKSWTYIETSTEGVEFYQVRRSYVDVVLRWGRSRYFPAWFAGVIGLAGSLSLVRDGIEYRILGGISIGLVMYGIAAVIWTWLKIRREDKVIAMRQRMSGDPWWMD